MTDPIAAVDAPRRGMAPVARAVVAGVFGLFYAYAVWNAVGNLVQSLAAASDVGLSLTLLGWVVWLIAILVPIVVFVIALAVAAHRRLGAHLLIMVTGLAVVAVLWLNVVAYTALNTSSLVG
ncbi:hypothetical protein GCM10009808_05030 [Microbacterium sediminicola]|uniref:Bacitracin resistance protein n=1 Tax=Microbacterium sediminicola TaxID=415210 RepID=A0ABN2HP51_9MICO